MARKHSQNHLLASLPPREFRRIEPHLLPYSTKAGEELHQRTGSSPYVYFPINSVSSLVITLADGSMVEAATVGNEGMVGLPLFVESESVSIQAFTHVPGNGLKMPRSVLRAELKRERALCHRLHEYTEALLLFIAQSCACNQMHSQRQRCARWLLLLHDRVGNQTFSLTQEFLAQMLGVRRATVTVAAGDLRRKKLIAYRKGVIQILDRKGLEDMACECYKTVCVEFERLKNTPST
ncbi:MAG TPA: Crp/Fnr family transcriptional regulator [Thermoanaerobaculia bacterium]|nr:Crp/Fnr family transcriptional regulator [Thermoanaerobaculia bacterium]